MVRHQVTFFDPAFLLQCQFAEHVPKMFPQLPVKHLPAVLGNENDVIFTLPLAVASSIANLLVCLAAHERRVKALDDRRKCQTATATPAEPGTSFVG